MRTPRFPRSRNLGVNMTPMIDMVFLLIIFFLVSNHLVRQESMLKVDLPQAASGDTESLDSPSRLTVTLLADGSMFVGGQPISQSALEERLSAINAAEKGDFEIRIRASREIPYRLVEPLMIACAKQGISQLSFAVHESESP